MSSYVSTLSTWARPPSSVSDTEPITDFARSPSASSLPDRSDTFSYASRIRGMSPGGPPIPYNPEREQRTREKYRKRAIENEELKDAAEILNELKNKRRKIGGGFSGEIIYQQQQQPAAVTGQVFTPADFHKLTGIGRKILRRAAKRSSKAAVMNQLMDFGRKNKKHAKKCLFYSKYVKSAKI